MATMRISKDWLLDIPEPKTAYRSVWQVIHVEYPRLIARVQVELSTFPEPLFRALVRDVTWLDPEPWDSEALLKRGLHAARASWEESVRNPKAPVFRATVVPLHTAGTRPAS